MPIILLGFQFPGKAWASLDVPGGGHILASVAVGRKGIPNRNHLSFSFRRLSHLACGNRASFSAAGRACLMMLFQGLEVAALGFQVLALSSSNFTNSSW